MKFTLSDQEIELLGIKDIHIMPDCEYSDDEALDLLDMVRDVEISYSQFTTDQSKQMYQKFANLADKLHSQIPED